MNTLLISLAIMVRKIDSTGLELWLQKRTEVGPLDGLWEFPGGKIETGEAPLAAAKRELLEETGLQLDEATPDYLLGIYPHEYPDRKVILYAHLFLGDFDPVQAGSWQRFSFEGDYDKTSLPKANLAILDDLLAHFAKQTPAALELLWPKSKS